MYGFADLRLEWFRITSAAAWAAIRRRNEGEIGAKMGQNKDGVAGEISLEQLQLSLPLWGQLFHPLLTTKTQTKTPARGLALSQQQTEISSCRIFSASYAEYHG